METLIQMGYEENDASLIPRLRRCWRVLRLILRISGLRQLSGEYDKCNAIVKLNAGAGGTEAMDWCSMLYRMYTRWANGFCCG